MLLDGSTSRRRARKPPCFGGVPLWPASRPSDDKTRYWRPILQRQRRLLARLHGEVAIAKADRAAEFDGVLAETSEYLRSTRPRLVEELRARAAAGEEMLDLRSLTKLLRDSPRKK